MDDETIESWRDRLIAAWQEANMLRPETNPDKLMQASIEAAEKLCAEGKIGILRGFAIDKENYVKRIRGK